MRPDRIHFPCPLELLRLVLPRPLLELEQEPELELELVQQVALARPSVQGLSPALQEPEHHNFS